MRRWLLAGMLWLTVGIRADALVTDWQFNENGRVRLISAYDAAPETGTLLFGLHFQPAPGWYLYWKNPGEAGIPPRVDWTGTRGLGTPELLFPQPDQLVLPGSIVEYGYEREIVYPIRTKVTGRAIEVQAKLTYLTCNTSCIPYTMKFSLTLPTTGSPHLDETSRALIETELARVPAPEMSDEAIQKAAHRYEKNPGTPLTSSPVPVGEGGLFGILLLAFLGGIILNVMPCVLPVLSIKLAGLLQHSGQSRAAVISSSLASAFGILTSFWLLALAAILAQRAGHAVGWGIQFQEPVFVAVLAAVVFLFGLNLWGLFEIGLPSVFGRFASSYGFHESLTSHFVSGMFATILATPCSAPFLGTAMGFALAQSPSVILMIFTAVGMGLALPYIALATFPSSVRWLPRPGVWMLHLKKGLALLLFATAAWLGWVLYRQLGPASAPAERIQGVYRWEPFSEAAIEAHLKEGKSVFVDVTADWCVTCKYNERFVLADEKVVDAFKREEIVMMQADWTSRDPAITAYLKKFGRAGIPFYAYYRPGRTPVLLSEFLTRKQVLDSLRS